MFIIIHDLTHTHITTMANAVAELKVKVSFGTLHNVHCTHKTKTFVAKQQLKSFK